MKFKARIEAGEKDELLEDGKTVTEAYASICDKGVVRIFGPEDSSMLFQRNRHCNLRGMKWGNYGLHGWTRCHENYKS